MLLRVSLGYRGTHDAHVTRVYSGRAGLRLLLARERSQLSQPNQHAAHWQTRGSVYPDPAAGSITMARLHRPLRDWELPMGTPLAAAPAGA